MNMSVDWQHFLDEFPRTVGCRLYRGMNALVLASGQHLIRKLALQHGFAAGQCHAAARVLVEGFVSEYLAEHLFDAHLPAGQLNGCVRTNRNAFAAYGAQCSIILMAVDKTMGAVFTDLQAVLTTDTSVEEELDLRFRPDTLRVVTPKTAQAATLEEDSRANARSIVDGESLDVYNCAREFGPHRDVRLIGGT